MDNKKYGIFNEVHFINEGEFLSAIGLLSLTTIGIPLALIGGCTLINSIKDRINLVKINKAIAKLEKDNNVKDFSSKIKSIKSISVDQLLKKMEVRDEDKKKYKYSTLSCAVIEDNSGRILAYGVSDVNNWSKYAYHIVDKKYASNKDIEKFVQAKFELHFGIMGPGIKSISGLEDGSRYKGYANGITGNNYKNYKAAELTDEEKKEAHKLFETLSKQLISKVKGALSSKYYLNISSYANKGYKKGILTEINVVLKDYADGNIESYNDSVSANIEMMKDLDKKLTPIFKSFGFNTETELKEDEGIIYITGTDSEKYCYFELNLTTPGDEDYDTCYHSINVIAKRDL